MARYATIDAGTNSTKMTIAEVDTEGEIKLLASDFEPTRLGMDMGERGQLSEAGIERTVAALCRFVALARDHKVDGIRAVATQFAREADNAAHLLVAVRERCGLKLEIISGEEEGELLYRGVARDFIPPANSTIEGVSSPLPPGGAGGGNMPLLVFNIGGGSTELIYGHGDKVQQVASVAVGASSVVKMYPDAANRVGKTRLRRIQHYIEWAIREQVGFLDDCQHATLVGSGGTVTNMGAIDNAQQSGSSEKVNLYRLPVARLRNDIYWLAELDEAERVVVPGLSPDRAGIIVGGALIALAIAHIVGAKEMLVSTRGLRDGILADFAARAQPGGEETKA